jgi:hypothetical protein
VAPSISAPAKFSTTHSTLPGPPADDPVFAHSVPSRGRVQGDVTITTKEVGTMVIAEVRIRAADYPLLYGKDATFDYGTDGHIIGAIKNFFDGVAKNHGRVIRIAVKKI